jgi:type II secretory pathway pseudopilin PulG
VAERLRRSSGFTLVETLIALVLSSFVILLASHAFLVQNQFYSTQTIRVGVQDNARAATELIAREVRNTAQDGVVVGGSRTLTVRSPVAMALVCHRQGSPSADVLSEGGEAALDVDAIAGVALRNGSTWEYVAAAWATLNGSDLNSAAECATNGADTVGVRDDFYRLTDLNTIFSGGVREGDVVMLYRETTFSIRTSQLDSTTLGLFRADSGGTPVEFATGIDTTAHFRYRTGPGTYVDTVPAVSLGDVDVVRIALESRRPPATGGADDITFGWAVNVPVRNVRQGGN